MRERLTGEWWLPEAVDRRPTGVLKIKATKHPELELLGPLELDEPWDAVRLALLPSKNYPVVFGRSSKDRPITLEACMVGNSEIHVETPEMAHVWLRVRRAWLGAHLPEPSSQTFARMQLQLDHLVDWVQPPLMRYERFGDGVVEAGLRQEGMAGDDAKAILAGAEIRISTSLQPSGDRVAQAVMQRHTTLTVDLEKPLAIGDWVEQFAVPIRNLITLAVGSDAVIRKIILGAPTNRDRDEEVEVASRWSRRPTKGAGVSPSHQLLFDVRSMPGGLDVAMRRWLDVSQDLRAILELFLAPQYAASIYEEHRFLNFADASEAYHRIRVGRGPLAKDVFDARVKSVVDKCPDEAKWIEGALRFSNNFSFPERLRALVSARPWLEGEVFKKVEPFVRRVSATRNYHTHWDDTSAGGAALGMDLWPLCEQLAVVLEACLLEELGFSQEEAAEAIRRASGHYRAIQFNRAICGLDPIAGQGLTG